MSSTQSGVISSDFDDLISCEIRTNRFERERSFNASTKNVYTAPKYRFQVPNEVELEDA